MQKEHYARILDRCMHSGGLGLKFLLGKNLKGPTQQEPRRGPRSAQNCLTFELRVAYFLSMFLSIKKLTCLKI